MIPPIKMHVVLIHGIGDQKEDWSDEIAQSLQNKVLVKLKEILKNQAPADTKAVLGIQSVYWADIFQKRQARLKSILDKFAERSPKKVEFKGSLWERTKKLFFILVSFFLKGIQSAVISDYIGDVIGYLHPASQRIVHERITGVLQVISKTMDNPNEKAPLTFVAHSLGTVITSNYIYDECKKRRPAKQGFSDVFRIDNLFTIGSPIALFSVRYDGPEAFGEPIHVESPTGRWINISDPEDPVGMPLKPLNEAYDRAVFKDVSVDAGVYGVAHTAYFNKTETLDIIANKLAVDWMALNEKLSHDKLTKLYSAYDKDFLAGQSSP